MSDYFHFQLSIEQRSRGGCAPRRSAYQSRTCLTLPDGTVVDYSARCDHVQTLMLAPAGAPDWALDPKQFWRKAAAAEVRADAQEARRLELALPRGLLPGHWADIARKLGLALVAHGMVVQVDIHCSTASDGKPCPHLHFLLSMRELEGGQFAAKKARHWNKLFYGKAAALRKQLADFLNAYCKEKGVAYVADPRSNATRGLPPAEMSLPRWNIVLYQRTGKKSPWLKQVERDRAERTKLRKLEAECVAAERTLARLRLNGLNGRDVAVFAEIGRQDAAVSREPIPARRPPVENKSLPPGAISVGQPKGGGRSQDGKAAPPASIPHRWISHDPDEPGAENGPGLGW